MTARFSPLGAIPGVFFAERKNKIVQSQIGSTRNG